ncbi:MBL fold metallo-hydrolase [Corallococcus aberystwythensis]|uniref:MBL fold metallo-hydrolase n=1 Tax=Corallococcus aberystwythensis TaxID=2316722 RepID=A0A3A8R4A9_9BACT|nr:MBL fold metallo-hydrolase [Corallococcus aberystwythensis]RKH74778.1 MBL fold metallo-hydrolase [Corallococcus aberystwythensis]
MLTEVQAGPYTVRGVSVGGVYTSLLVPELGVLLDAGIPIRSFATTDRIFLSHGHADHASALGSLMGIRALVGKGPPFVYLPAEIEAPVQEALAALGRLHRMKSDIRTVPLRPGDTVKVQQDLWVRAFRTHHPVPSLGYQFLRRVAKLKPEYRELPPEEIGRRRQAGEPLFDEVERLELAYCTDTLSNVLERQPSLFDSRVLILECTFIDAERTVRDAQERAHIHLEEIASMADRFQNEALVLMHFSQAYSPAQVHATLQARLPASLLERVRVFAPDSGRWFG